MQGLSQTFACALVLAVAGMLQAEEAQRTAAQQLRNAVGDAIAGANQQPAVIQSAGFALPPAVPTRSHITRDEVRHELREAAMLLRSDKDRRNLNQLRQAVTRLRSLHAALDASDALDRRDQHEFRQQVRHRLLRLGDQIVDLTRLEMGKEERAARKAGQNGPAVMQSLSMASLAAGCGVTVAEPYPWLGGAAQRQAAELIELIRNTIQPDHWDVNGGPGSIYYYAPFHALVVTASSEVHWTIGGLRGALGN